MTNSQRTMVGVWLGFFTSTLFLAANYLMMILLGVPVLSFVLFNWLARVLPGNIVTSGIDLIIEFIHLIGADSTDRTAKTIERLIGVILMLLIGAIIGAIYGRIRWINSKQQGVIAAIVPLILTLAIVAWADWGEESPVWSMVWFALAWGAWGALMANSLNHAERLSNAGSGTTTDSEGRITITGPIITRRMFLTQTTARVIGASVLVGAGGWALRGLLANNPLAGIQLAEAGTPDILRGSMEDNFMPAPGSRSEITSNENFYTIDINLFPPNVDTETWELRIEGLVEKRLKFTYDEMQAIEAVAQYATLACISNPVGGDLIGNTMWTGVRLNRILDMAGVKPEAQEVKFYCEDGYYEVLPLEDAMREETLLCYGMNGESLEIKHGFPLRLYTPGRFGMKNPKWIHTIELIKKESKGGYWHKRGWDREAYFKMTTIIDPVQAEIRDGKLIFGGIAFSGDKGISKVEVRLDDGAWLEAELREPLSPFTWVQWKAEIPYPKNGDHRITARCYDLNGTPQTVAEADTRPSGATGYHELEVEL